MGRPKLALLPDMDMGHPAAAVHVQRPTQSSGTAGPKGALGLHRWQMEGWEHGDTRASNWESWLEAGRRVSLGKPDGSWRDRWAEVGPWTNSQAVVALQRRLARMQHLAPRLLSQPQRSPS